MPGISTLSFHKSMVEKSLFRFSFFLNEDFYQWLWRARITKNKEIQSKCKALIHLAYQTITHYHIGKDHKNYDNKTRKRRTRSPLHLKSVLHLGCSLNSYTNQIAANINVLYEVNQTLFPHSKLKHKSKKCIKKILCLISITP